MMDPNKPHLNRKPGSSTGSASDGSGSSSGSSTDDSDRPTLQRRPDDSSSGN